MPDTTPTPCCLAGALVGDVAGQSFPTTLAHIPHRYLVAQACWTCGRHRGDDEAAARHLGRLLRREVRQCVPDDHLPVGDAGDPVGGRDIGWAYDWCIEMPAPRPWVRTVPIRRGIEYTTRLAVMPDGRWATQETRRRPPSLLELRSGAAPDVDWTSPHPFPPAQQYGARCAAWCARLRAMAPAPGLVGAGADQSGW